MNKFKKFVEKIVQPTPLDKIIRGIAKPLEAGKLEDSLIIELNEKICRKRRTPPPKFLWIIFYTFAFAFAFMLYAVFLEFDNIFIRIIGIILYIGICIGGGRLYLFSSI